MTSTPPFSPSTYYGITKVASAQLIDLERRERRLWGVTTILFNHESTRRSPDFLSRKVTRSAAGFKASSIGTRLELRDLSARTDWSAASDFVRAMHAALQVDQARDYVLASGVVHTVLELVEEALRLLIWTGAVLFLREMPSQHYLVLVYEAIQNARNVSSTGAHKLAFAS